MTSRIVLSPVIQNNINALQRAQRLIDQTTERLATGLAVNSALDNPQNYFTARSLRAEARDTSKLLDGIGQNIRALQSADTSLKALSRLIDQAESIAIAELEKISAGISSLATVTDPLATQILSGNPVGYWRFDETAGGTAFNQGTIGAPVNASYSGSPTLGAPALYSDANTSVDLNGVNQFVSIPNHILLNTGTFPARSVELVFNADTTSGRQVLYEEGGNVNNLSIYIFNGSLYINGNDSGDWGPVNISTPITAGQTYHVAFTFDSVNNIFRGYVDGTEIGNAVTSGIFPSHSGNIGVGAMSNSAWFHDGVQTGNGFYFDGRISDLAVHNTVLSAQDIINHAVAAGVSSGADDTNKDFNLVLSQIDQLVKDSHYRGINLLNGGEMTTFFNTERTHRLITNGSNFTSPGLGIKHIGFDSEASINTILETVRNARNEVRQFARSIASDLGVITTRQTFSQNLINTLRSGADDLTVADQNEEGANLLAAQLRQELATTALSLANIFNASVLSLFEA